MAVTRKRARRVRLDPDQRITAIVAATRQLVDEKGYENVLTTEVAARCQISEATIYKYFETKRELLTSVAEQWFDEVLTAPRGSQKKKSIRDRLRQSIWESLMIVRHSPSISRFIMTELRRDPTYRQRRIYQQNKEFTNRTIDLLQEAVASGEFRQDVSVDLLRNLIFGAIEHHTWAYLRGEGDYDVDAAADGIAEVVFRGMVAAPKKATAARRKTLPVTKAPRAPLLRALPASRGNGKR